MKLPAVQKAVVEKLQTGEAKSVVVARRIVTRELVEKAPLLPKDTKYKILYADPAWRYSNMNGPGAPEKHYSTLSITEICDLQVCGKSVKELAADNAVLFLWTTSTMWEACLPVIKAWGFELKSSYVWDKVKPFMGTYNNMRHEFLLVCTRGSCLPESPERFDSVQVIEKSDTHSEKPEKFREIIDSLYPTGRRIELFARKIVKRWDAWGDEIPDIFHRADDDDDVQPGTSDDNAEIGIEPESIPPCLLVSPIIIGEPEVSPLKRP